MQNNWSPCLQEQHSRGKKPYLGVLKHFTILKMEVQFLLFIYLFIYFLQCHAKTAITTLNQPFLSKLFCTCRVRSIK